MIWNKIDNTWKLKVPLPDNYPEFTAEIVQTNVTVFVATIFINTIKKITFWNTSIESAMQDAEKSIKLEILEVAKHKATPNLKNIKDVEQFVRGMRE